MSGIDIGFVLPPRVQLQGAYTRDLLVTSVNRNTVSFVVPTGYYAMIVVFSVQFQTDATVGNRQVTFQASNVIAGAFTFAVEIPAGVLQPASTTWTYTFALDVDTSTTQNTLAQSVRLPRLVFPPGSLLTLFANVPGAGDTLNLPGFVRVALFSTGGPPQRELLRPAAELPAPLSLGG